MSHGVDFFKPNLGEIGRIEVVAPEAVRFYRPQPLPNNTLLPREQEFVSSYCLQYANKSSGDGRPVLEDPLVQRMVEYGLTPESLRVEFDFGNGRRGGIIFRRT